MVSKVAKKMVIGDGMLARAFKNAEGIPPETIIFASGVSNSLETDHREFEREKDLLLTCLSENRTLVYFSTVSVSDPSMNSSPYILHKRNIENLIEERFNKHIIIRLPIVVGKSDNPHTLTNYLYHAIINGIHFYLHQNAFRYLMDLDDVVKLVSLLMSRQPGQLKLDLVLDNRVSVHEIVDILSDLSGRPAHYTLVTKGSCYSIENSLAKQLLGEEYFIMDPKKYIADLLHKYYKGTR